MAEEKDQLHHCERCAAVFSAPAKIGLSVVCSECGEQPTAGVNFESRVKAETVIDTDRVHGVAGKDLADFVSMQKIRRQKQVRMAIVLWVTLLVVGPATYFYLNSKSEAEQELVDEANKADLLKLQKVESQAMEGAIKAFDGYLKANGENEKSAFVVGGVKQLLKLAADIKDLSATRPDFTSIVVSTDYFEEGEYPRVEFIVEVDSDQKFEVVCWNIDGSWKLDWDQHVRYSFIDYKSFTASKLIEESTEFRLFVRRRHSMSMKRGQDLQLLFYESEATVGDRSADYQEVTIKSDDPLYTELNKQFEALAAKKDDSDLVVGSEDPDGMLRVRATLSYTKGEDGDPKLKINKISAYHWMSFDPGE